jgi:hypothetical protein
MPVAVATMMLALDEMNTIVRILRTTTTVEVYDISEILQIDTSGEGERLTFPDTTARTNHAVRSAVHKVRDSPFPTPQHAR